MLNILFFCFLPVEVAYITYSTMNNTHKCHLGINESVLERGCRWILKNASAIRHDHGINELSYLVFSFCFKRVNMFCSPPPFTNTSTARMEDTEPLIEKLGVSFSMTFMFLPSEYDLLIYNRR